MSGIMWRRSVPTLFFLAVTVPYWILTPAKGQGGGGLEAPNYNATALCQGEQPAEGFISGVASGDPTQDAVIIWTRYQPPGDGDPSATYPVDWVVSTQPSLSPVVANGTFTARPEADFTVKVDVTGLDPNTSYYYAFRHGEYASHLGITKTLPTLDQAVEQLRYAILSCANWGYGYFNVYDLAARVQDLDFWVFLGDYIYEYNSSYYPSPSEAVREQLIPPGEVFTLKDYQERFRLYKTDPALQELHRRAPVFATWDDHDQQNNSWKNGSATVEDPEVWARRKHNAATAYRQYMPIRDPGQPDRLYGRYRAFTYGNLATLVVPETRLQFRAKQFDYKQHPYIQLLANNEPGEWDSLPELNELRRQYIEALQDPDRTQMGVQVDWVARDFQESTDAGVTWQILASPTIFSPRRTPDVEAAVERQYGSLISSFFDSFLNFATGTIADELLSFGGTARILVGTGRYHDTVFVDPWDGYQYERERLIDIFANSSNNAVVIAGDSHNAWGSNLYRNMVKYNPGATVSAEGPVLGVEFATASVTSPGIQSYTSIIPFGQVLDVMEEGLFISNPELVYANVRDRGTVILTVTPEVMQGDYYFVSTIGEADYESQCKRALQVTAGQMSQGMQNGTCTAPADLLYRLYSPQDPLPQEAGLTSPAFSDAVGVTNCGTSTSAPTFVPIRFVNGTAWSEEGGGTSDGGEVEEENGDGGVLDEVSDTVSSWFGK